jgi:hypothetical protein
MAMTIDANDPGRATTIDPNDPATREKFRTLQERMNGITQKFEMPDGDFDARRVDRDELDKRYGIPPPPDPRVSPRLHAFWTRMLAPTRKFVPAEFAFSFLLISPPIASSVTFYQLNYRPTGFGGHHQRSRNWSGGTVTPKANRCFVELHASWQVPTLNVPATASPAVTEFRNSTWIGFDGQRRYLHSSLPQIGTSQILTRVGSGVTSTAEAWWQWWVRGHMFPPLTLTTLAVHPGDLIMSSMIVTDPTHVKFMIVNTTTGVAVCPFIVPAPSVDMAQGPTPVQLKVSGATAEWIMERPTVLGSDLLYHLPDYNTVDFNECLAGAIHRSGTGRDQDLTGAKFINMYEIRENPHRTADISIARWVGDEQLATIYR